TDTDRDSTIIDRDPGNNSAIGFVNFVPPAAADLAVAVTGAPDPVRVGDALTYTVTVTNLGPSDASAATLTVTLPAGAAFDLAMTSRFLSQLYPDLLGRPID